MVAIAILVLGSRHQSLRFSDCWKASQDPEGQRSHLQFITVEGGEQSEKNEVNVAEAGREQAPEEQE